MLQNDFEYWRGCRGSKNQLANYTISWYSLKEANIVFGCYIDQDVHQLISASVLTPTPHFILNTSELKSQILKKVHKDSDDSEYKIFMLLLQKTVRLLSKRQKSSWWKQDVILKNVIVFRFILHWWRLVFISVFHFKVQMVLAIAGIGVALGDVVLWRGQGK